jgi:hypothetical protein
MEIPDHTMWRVGVLRHLPQMSQLQNHPKRRSVPARDLSGRERVWIQEILNSDPRWSDVDLSETKVIAECDCGECRTAYLDGPQNQAVIGTRGYIGRIEIRTDNDFGITVTLDQLDGRLSELYVNALDLSDDGSRPFPDHWGELAHIVEPM